MLSEANLAEIAAKHGLLKENVKGRGTEIAALAFGGVEVFAGAVAAGYVNGRWASAGKDHFALGGIPMDLATGAVGLLAAAFDAFGPFNSHVAHLAMGTSAAYFVRLGMNQGNMAREKAQQAQALAQGPQAAGILPPKAVEQASAKTDKFAWAKQRAA
jgi:hypothetical protein